MYAGRSGEGVPCLFRTDCRSSRRSLETIVWRFGKMLFAILSRSVVAGEFAAMDSEMGGIMTMGWFVLNSSCVLAFSKDLVPARWPGGAGVFDGF